MNEDQYRMLRQLSLFDDKHCLRNEGMLELTRLDLEFDKVRISDIVNIGGE